MCSSDLVPSLLRGFSAPVKLRTLSLDRLVFLAKHDSDPFARWEAGQQLATRALLNMVDAYRRGEALSLDGDVIDILRRALAQADADPAFAAEVLALPGEMFLGDQMAEVDVEAIHTARQAARAQVGHALNAELALMYERLTDTGPYRIDGASIGRRALRNACLSYLAAAGSESAVERLDKQFHAAGNMTDVLAALTNLVEFERPERDKALAKFYEDWSQDDLVVDKWFGVQAMSSLPGTLDRVKALTRHKAFDFKNPNRLRALVAAFAHANQVRFHDAGGAGYAFLADQIIALDPFNATVAARVMQPLAAWRRHESGRRELMQRELRRILAQPNVSKNVYEVATKSLSPS